MNLARLLFPVLLAPLLATAGEPVRVSTHMSGQLDAFPVILERLGIGDYWERPGPLPFSLTVDTILDPDDLAGSCKDNWCYTIPASVSYTITIDGKTVGFTDSSHATISWSRASFQNGTHFATEPYPSVTGSLVSFAAWVNGPEGSFPADPFAPQFLDESAVTGYLSMSVSPLDPEIPGFWTAHGVADTIDFQVSVVPEPTGTAMLAAGLAVLAATARRRGKSELGLPPA
jgi:hypothetical protein